MESETAVETDFNQETALSVNTNCEHIADTNNITLESEQANEIAMKSMVNNNQEESKIQNCDISNKELECPSVGIHDENKHLPPIEVDNESTASEKTDINDIELTSYSKVIGQDSDISEVENKLNNIATEQIDVTAVGNDDKNSASSETSKLVVDEISADRISGQILSESDQSNKPLLPDTEIVEVKQEAVENQTDSDSSDKPAINGISDLPIKPTCDVIETAKITEQQEQVINDSPNYRPSGPEHEKDILKAFDRESAAFISNSSSYNSSVKLKKSPPSPDNSVRQTSAHNQVVQPDTVKEPEEEDHKDKCQLLKEEERNMVEADAAGGDANKSSSEKDIWTYVLGHNQLKKRVIREGLEMTRPSHGQRVTIRCCGKLGDGTEVDKHDKLTFVLGDSDVIQAFDLCVALMNKDEICEIYTDTRFAYGAAGRSPDIPSSSHLMYEAELLSVEDVPDPSELPLTDRISLGGAKRLRGNELFLRGEYSRAIDVYSRALKILESQGDNKSESDGELQQLVDTRVMCYNNLAIAQIKIDAWDTAIKSCDSVLKIQPKNVKALYRKGKCLDNKGEVGPALALLRKATKLEPDTKVLQQELIRLETKLKRQSTAEKQLYQKMLGTDKSVQKTKKNWWPWYIAGAGIISLIGIVMVTYRGLS